MAGEYDSHIAHKSLLVIDYSIGFINMAPPVCAGVVPNSERDLSIKVDKHHPVNQDWFSTGKCLTFFFFCIAYCIDLSVSSAALLDLILYFFYIYLCLGFRPYSRWSYFWFSALSAAQLINVLGSSCSRRLLNREISAISRGRPLWAILLITQTPSRVLRNV